MFCVNCGFYSNDNINYCPICGSALHAQPSTYYYQSEIIPTQNAVSKPVHSSQKSISLKNKTTIGLCSGLVILIFILFGCIFPLISLNADTPVGVWVVRNEIFYKFCKDGTGYYLDRLSDTPDGTSFRWRTYGDTLEITYDESGNIRKYTYSIDGRYMYVVSKDNTSINPNLLYYRITADTSKPFIDILYEYLDDANDVAYDIAEKYDQWLGSD